MKKTIIAMMAVALTLGMTSCNKENTTPIENGPDKQVTMRIGGVRTRAAAAGEAIGAKTAILNDGYVVFASTAGNISKVIKFGTSESITPTMLASGHKFIGIPNNAASVYVYGNVPSTITIPNVGTLASINALLVGVATQADVTVGVDRVSLYGGAAIDATIPTDLKAIFSIKPIAARIEITDVVVSGDLQSFKVDGIFINNYYIDAQLDGKMNTAVGNNLKNVGQGGATVYIDGVAPYVSPFPLYNYDPTVGLLPTASKVWAYNVLAPSDNTTVHTHVIIRLSSIVAAGGSTTKYPGTQFVTVKKFKDTGVVLDFLTAGKVYQLNSIAINETHLTEEAEMDVIDVTVDADVVDWAPVAVTPEM